MNDTIVQGLRVAMGQMLTTVATPYIFLIFLTVSLIDFGITETGISSIKLSKCRIDVI